MKRTYCLYLLPVAVFFYIALVPFGGCEDKKHGNITQKETTEKKPKKPIQKIEIVDGNGETILVRKPVERIIVEYTDTAELVRILNRVDRVVGVAGFDYIFEKCERQFPGLKSKPFVGFFHALDYESVLKLNPDLLLTFGNEINEKRAKLPGVDVVFLGLYYPNLLNPDKSRFLQGVDSLGKILDAEKRAEEYIAWYIGLIEKIRKRTEKLAENSKPKVLISSYRHFHTGTNTYSAYNEKDTLGQAAILAGAKNIGDELLEFSQTISIPVDPEWLMLKNPDIIILHAVDLPDVCGFETDDITKIKNGLNHFISRPELTRIDAIKNKKVYVFDGHFRNDASGGILAGAYMARIFHPELFEDLDPESIHREYLLMQGLGFDSDQYGIFVYPPLEKDDGLMGVPDRYKGEKF